MAAVSVSSGVHERFAAGDHHDFHRMRGQFAHQLIHRSGSVRCGIPRFLDVAPMATHVAAAGSDEPGRAARVKSFALQGIKGLHDREFKSGEYGGMGFALHDAGLRHKDSWISPF